MFPHLNFDRLYLDTTSFTCTHLCVLILCSFIACIDSCDHTTVNAQGRFITRIPPATLSKRQPLSSPPTTSLTPETTNSVHLYHFVISKMLNKWKNALFNLMRLAFLFSIIPLRWFQLLCASIVCSFYYLVVFCVWITTV